MKDCETDPRQGALRNTGTCESLCTGAGLLDPTAELSRMLWFEVTFMVEAESSEAHADFNEDEIAVALPGTTAYLAAVEERSTVADSVSATWRRLRRSG